MQERIDIERIWDATDGGKSVILHYYPQAAAGFDSRRNFSIRPDDRSPSCTVFRHKDGIWMLQDKGGADTDAKNAVKIVMERESLKFVEALTWIAQNFAPSLISEGTRAPVRQPRLERAPQAEEAIRVGRRESGKFTKAELDILGYEITQEHCDAMSLIPLDYYVTAKNAKGESWIIHATETYPIYYWDYRAWGKIYQPFGEIRFIFCGKKPERFIFGDNKVMKLIDKAREGHFPEVSEADNIDEREEELIICSGGSDALNVFAAGFHVCWLNSETEELDRTTFYNVFQRIAKNIYVLYDMDNTGIREAQKLALKYLDLYLVRLPDDLKRFKTRSGKPCKDAKDFFVHYRTAKVRNPRKHFQALVKISMPLKFWMEKKDTKGNFSGYDINNEYLYEFLRANGIQKLSLPSERRSFTYVHIKDNIVTTIAEEDFQSYINNFLREWIRENPEYYNIHIINAINRSNQVKLASIEKIRTVDLDFRSYTRDFDYFFFRNTAVRITPTGVEPYKIADIDKYVFDSKIIDHDFRVLPPAFEVSYTPEYAALQRRFTAATPNSPEWADLRDQMKAIREQDRYSLDVRDWDFSFLKFLYNTGRVFWKKEEAGYQLSEDEQKEVNLHFISKVAALGYQLYRYKERGRPYVIYAMETEQSTTGTHLGGTGKSLCLSSIEYLRKQLFIDGQQPSMQDSEHLFSGVQRGITEHIFFDDLSSNVDLHRFMPMVTGKMTVRALYRNTEVIEYEDSPKCGFTSNHGIMNFDASLRRRTWFIAFSSYYHPEDRNLGLSERSPLTEFGKNLIIDYTPEEMNRFYNFMATCLHTYLRFRQRILPPMEAIERRNIQRAIGDEFIWWANDYFTEDRLNVNIPKEEAFLAYKETLPKKIAENIKMATFKTRLMQWCQYMSEGRRKYTFNPEDLLKTETERSRRDIREFRDYKDVYCFHIRTIDDSASAPAPFGVRSETGKLTEENGGDPDDTMPF